MNAGTSELTRLEISFHSLKGVIFSKGCWKKERKNLIPLLTAEIWAEGNSPVRSVSYMLQEQQNRKVQQGIILFYFLKKFLLNLWDLTNQSGGCQVQRSLEVSLNIDDNCWLVWQKWFPDALQMKINKLWGCLEKKTPQQHFSLLRSMSGSAALPGSAWITLLGNAVLADSSLWNEPGSSQSQVRSDARWGRQCFLLLAWLPISKEINFFFLSISCKLQL